MGTLGFPLRVIHGADFARRHVSVIDAAGGRIGWWQ
jgi:hypothetical protein